MKAMEQIQNSAKSGEKKYLKNQSPKILASQKQED